MEALQEGLRACVLIGIETLAGVRVARQEVLEAQDVGVPGPPDDHRAAGAALDQLDAAQDQRAHDALAELSLLDQQAAQLLRWNHSASTSESAIPSTSDGRPESWASSPVKEPGPCVTIGAAPSSRGRITTSPLRRMNMPGVTSPVFARYSPAR